MPTGAPPETRPAKQRAEMSRTPSDVDVPRADDATPAGAAEPALQALLDRMNARPDLPAMSASIRRIAELASSENEKLDNLAAAILNDVSLTARVLRLVNSPAYRHAGHEPIGTMARAVMLLGVETVRSLAMSVILFEHLADREHAGRLRDELVHATLCGAIARGLAGRIGADHEQAWLCGMFHRLGRMLALYHFPDEVDEVDDLVRRGGATEQTAARRVLGVGFDALGMAVARAWGFADAVVASMAVPAPGEPVPHAIGHDTRLRVLTGLSAELLDSLEHHDGRAREQRIDRIARRYGPPTGVTGTEMRAVLGIAAEYVCEVAGAIGIDLGATPLGPRIVALRGEAGATGPAPDAATNPADAAATPADALLSAITASAITVSTMPAPAGEPASDAPVAPRGAAVLADGLAELSRALADGCTLNEATRLALEILYRGLEMQRVLFALREPRANALVGKLGVGAGLPALLPRLRVPLGSAGDLFTATAARGADLLIADTRAPNLARWLPPWHAPFGAGSFLLLPMTLKGSTVAMIYGDRAAPLTAPPDAQQGALVRAIRNQLVLSIQQAR